MDLSPSAAAHGQHHILSLDTVASIQDGKLVLNIPVAEAAQKEKPVV